MRTEACNTPIDSAGRPSVRSAEWHDRDPPCNGAMTNLSTGQRMVAHEPLCHLEEAQAMHMARKLDPFEWTESPVGASEPLVLDVRALFREALGG
jgi:hypothetical protein